MKTETVRKVQRTENTIFDRKAKNSKNEKKTKQKQKKFQKCPKSHICKRHQKTEKVPEETKLAMKLKKF